MSKTDKDVLDFEGRYSLVEVKAMALEKGIATTGTKGDIVARLLATKKTTEPVEIKGGVYKVPQWPEVKGVFVGGCVKRGAGSSFRAKAHAHNVKGGTHFGWICFRSAKRLGEVTGDVITKPSQLLWHEYAHILTPNHPHDDTWRKKMKELGQPITEQYRKKPKPKIVYEYFCPSCENRWEGSFTMICPGCGKSGIVSTRKE